jgi:hypothetical protein
MEGSDWESFVEDLREPVASIASAQAEACQIQSLVRSNDCWFIYGSLCANKLLQGLVFCSQWPQVVSSVLLTLLYEQKNIIFVWSLITEQLCVQLESMQLRMPFNEIVVLCGLGAFGVPKP